MHAQVYDKLWLPDISHISKRLTQKESLQILHIKTVWKVKLGAN